MDETNSRDRDGVLVGRGVVGWAVSEWTALNVTDAQKAQHKAIFEAERESARGVEDQLRKIRSTMTAAATSGGSEANIDLLASHTKAFAKFYATLTEEQKGGRSALS